MVKGFCMKKVDATISGEEIFSLKFWAGKSPILTLSSVQLRNSQSKNLSQENLCLLPVWRGLNLHYFSGHLLKDNHRTNCQCCHNLLNQLLFSNQHDITVPRRHTALLHGMSTPGAWNHMECSKQILPFLFLIRTEHSRDDPSLIQSSYTEETHLHNPVRNGKGKF